MISIITINYNNKAGLEKTVRSVLNQTFGDIEHIIIDGASIDGSAEYIKDNASFFYYWISEPDDGIYSAMNKGIDKASGKYLLFLNSGDFLASNNVIENLVKGDLKSDFIYGNLLKEHDGKREVDSCFKGKEITLLDFFRGTLSHPSTLIKRDLFNKYGLYDETLKIAADWKFFLVAIGINASSVLYRDIDVTVFNMSGVSQTDFSLLKKERMEVLNALLPKSIYSDYIFFSDHIEVLKGYKKLPHFLRKFIQHIYKFCT